MQKFNKILAPAFLGLSMSLLLSVNSHASVDGWKAENGRWKYYKDYKVLKSWQKLGDNWYFFNEDGSLKTGWLKDGNNNWYFLDLNSGSNQGVLLSGWQWIDGYCYYFETSDSGTLGRMYADKTVDGYKLNPMGRWVDNNGKELYDATRGISTNKQNLSSDKDLAKKASTAAKRSGSTGGVSRGSGGSSSGGGGSSSSVGISSNSGSSFSSGGGFSSSYNRGSDSLGNSNSNSAKDSLIQGNNNSGSTDSSLNSAGGSSSANIGSSSNSDLSSYLGSVTKPSTGLVSQNQDSIRPDSNNKTSTNSKQNTVPDNLNNKKAEYAVQKNPKASNENTPPPFATENSTGSNAQDLVTQPDTPSDNTNPSDSTTATSSNAAPKPENPENKEIPDVTEDNKKQDNENKPKEQEEDRAAKVKDLLTTSKNNNVVQYADENGKIRTIIWVKGISAPIMGEGGDFRKEVTHAGSDIYIDYKAPFAFGNSWYDINKSRAGGNTDIDKNLCFGATSANMLHWWLEQNSSYIDNYIAKEGDITRSGRNLSELINSFNNQQDSGIFELFKVLFGYNDKGFYSDLLMDLFINGYTPKISGATNIENEDMTPDNRGGFFYNAFKEVKLTERTYGGSYEDLSEKLKDILGNEGIIGISHKTFGNSSHIVTLWGAEYDLNRKLSAVYISDSDDQNEEADETDLGMKRYEIRNVGGIAKLSTNQSNKNTGSAIGYLHVLYLGTEQWQNYINQ